jgi:hypothetical protein
MSPGLDLQKSMLAISKFNRNKRNRDEKWWNSEYWIYHHMYRRIVSCSFVDYFDVSVYVTASANLSRNDKWNRKLQLCRLFQYLAPVLDFDKFIIIIYILLELYCRQQQAITKEIGTIVIVYRIVSCNCVDYSFISAVDIKAYIFSHNQFKMMASTEGER